MGEELGCANQTVLRYRREIESRSKALGNFIALERAKNDRKVSPEALDPPHSVDNDPENYVTM